MNTGLHLDEKCIQCQKGEIILFPSSYFQRVAVNFILLFRFSFIPWIPCRSLVRDVDTDTATTGEATKLLEEKFRGRLDSYMCKRESQRNREGRISRQDTWKDQGFSADIHVSPCRWIDGKRKIHQFTIVSLPSRKNIKEIFLSSNSTIRTFLYFKIRLFTILTMIICWKGKSNNLVFCFSYKKEIEVSLLNEETWKTFFLKWIFLRIRYSNRKSSYREERSFLR